MSGTDGWGYFIQGGDAEYVDAAGVKLNLAISCDIHYPAFNKRMFECKCGRIFPVWMVQAYDEDTLRKIHEGGTSD